MLLSSHNHRGLAYAGITVFHVVVVANVVCRTVYHIVFGCGLLRVGGRMSDDGTPNDHLSNPQRSTVLWHGRSAWPRGRMNIWPAMCGTNT